MSNAVSVIGVNIKRYFTFIGLLFIAISSQALEVEMPQVALINVSTEIKVSDVAKNELIEIHFDGKNINGIADQYGQITFMTEFTSSGTHEVLVSQTGSDSSVFKLRVIPAWISVVPPLLAILMALLLRNVIPALIAGIWFGAAALISFSPTGIFQGLLNGFQVYVVKALSNEDHAAIILFSMMIGGMVGIITRNGGMNSIVMLLVSRAKTAIGGQVSVWLMGLMIFFDDYSNTLVVGNTARPLTDHLKISREKLAYIVDSTAAPVVCLALITTWIGYEVGLIDAALSGIPELTQPAYTVFLHSIPYSFYPILAIIFVFTVAYTGKDMGPMYKAEVRARNGQVSPINSMDTPAIQGDNLEPKAGVKMRAINAFVPIIVLIVSLLAGLYITGEGENLTDIIGSANSYVAMLWASLLGAMTAAIMTISQKILSTHETVDAWFGGVRAMLFAMIVLILAWALSDISRELHTADYLVSILADSLPATMVPATVFVLSAITAFTTGTSWGTLGILMPLVVPLCWAVMQVNGMATPEHMHILYSAIACNLAGAVWGDHCSPISDTTVLSSMASGCDHIEHVRTQMPYALLVGFVAIIIGTVPGAYGLSPIISILLGAVILIGVLSYFGKTAK
ncbi:MAG: Na+/H+ antiporter NhaC family protein [Pseudomonadota bacterium]|nr:Na+/H+ antiporter NhaC family protein [Pseudomonadota bacterium]